MNENQDFNRGKPSVISETPISNWGGHSSDSETVVFNRGSISPVAETVNLDRGKLSLVSETSARLEFSKLLGVSQIKIITN